MHTFTNSQKKKRGVWYKIHIVFMIHSKFYKLFYKQMTYIQKVRKNSGGILYQRYFIIDTKILYEV